MKRIVGIAFLACGLVPLDVATALAREQVYFFHNDHLGTPQMMTDRGGRVVWKAEYDPFGKATLNEDPDGDGQLVTNNLRFPGQYYDAETGLHYNWHRFYDPDTGRYLQPDPIGLDGGLNLYAYVSNNPIVDIDPTGLYKHKKGGPRHPVPSDRFACKGTDPCPVLKGKIWVINTMLASHILYDVRYELPRGGEGHGEEITNLFKALIKCRRFYANKCTSDCDDKKPPGPPSPSSVLPGLLPFVVLIPTLL